MTITACASDVLFRLCAIADGTGGWITLQRAEFDEPQLDGLALLCELGHVERASDIPTRNAMRVRVTWNGRAQVLALQRELIV
jgi:hypothetical protein